MRVMAMVISRTVTLTTIVTSATPITITIILVDRIIITIAASMVPQFTTRTITGDSINHAVATGTHRTTHRAFPVGTQGDVILVLTSSSSSTFSS